MTRGPVIRTASLGMLDSHWQAMFYPAVKDLTSHHTRLSKKNALL